MDNPLALLESLRREHTGDAAGIVEEAERLATAASPGPWMVSRARQCIDTGQLGSDGEIYDGYSVVPKFAMEMDDDDRALWERDASFIARSRTLVPELAMALRLLTARAQAGKAVVEAARRWMETDTVEANRDGNVVAWNTRCDAYADLRAALDIVTSLRAEKQHMAEGLAAAETRGDALAEALLSISCQAAEGPEAYALSGKRLIDLLMDIGRVAGAALAAHRKVRAHSITRCRLTRIGVNG